MSSSIPPSTPGKMWQPPAPEDLAAELPQYEILGLLGRGGMGAVYRARQRSLDREVAIKILPPTAEDRDMHFAERFKAEARSMAKLEHPGIVAVYDAGETANGLLYFVMQFVQGTDVARMIAASGRLPPAHAHAIAAHVCDALAYAHANGLIHRDIKPANIMVDMQGRVKVADFGLAKMANDTQGFTQSNMAVGTPDFVAPEALVAGMPVDGRADLYAVGVMLYQMLTGEVPRGAWMVPSIRVPGIDPRFDQIVIKAMQVDREARHGSAVELRAHLDSLLMPTVPAPDLQRYSSAGMAKASAAAVAGVCDPGGGRQPAASPAAKPGHPPPASQRPATTVPAKSKVPLFIGIGVAAAIGIGALVMFSGGKPERSGGTPAAVGGAVGGKSAATPTGPIKVIEAPKPGARSGGTPVAVATQASQPAPGAAKVEMPKPAAPELKKEEPKPAMTAANSAPAAPAPATGVSPLPSPAPPAPVSGSPSLPISAAPGLPPELAALDAQFIALQQERVSAPFEADLAKLNSSYRGAISSKIAEGKAAGHLDAILALEAEAKAVAGVYDPGGAARRSGGSGSLPLPGSQRRATTSPVPDEDDENTPASLKALRTIYRTAHAKLEATRATNLKALTDPLDKRLIAMETDFTKADRLADAKVVRGYREALGESRLARQSEGDAAAPDRALASTPTAAVSPAAVLALKDGITNSLGMRFLPVKGADVLFCIHETRYKDYAAYAADAPGVDGSWKDQTCDGFAITERSDEHPVIKVSWEDAQKFCAWLSKKEGKTYRLPTDEEWSVAVGLGRKEKHGKNITPAMLSGKENTEFPWGDDFPPKGKEPVGNYSDESRKAKAPRGDAQYLENYDDGYPTTAPVMSFKPNKLGLYDLSGNVWEWCEDWYDNAQKDRVLRGGSWSRYGRGALLSSHRYHSQPGYRTTTAGFVWCWWCPAARLLTLSPFTL